MTIERDPLLPDPFNLKKKTVVFPNITDYEGRDPMLFKLAQDHAVAQEDRNTMLASMQWNNRATWARLDEGEKLLAELQFIKRIGQWALAGIGSILVLGLGTIMADWFSHLAGWK